MSELRAALRDAFGAAMIAAGVPAPGWLVRPRLSRARILESGTPIQYRAGYRQELQTLDAAFCLGYGIDEYSASAINYLCGAHAKLPSLRGFLDVDGFSAGNIVVALTPGSEEVRFVPHAPMKLVGHSTDVGPRKRKPYVAALGVHFENAGLRDVLGDMARTVDHAECNMTWLDEIVVDSLQFPMFYICRYCGRLHTCECFREHVDRDEQRRHLGGRADLVERVGNLGFASRLCHLCRGGVPRHRYGHPMYYSSFGQRYLPYIELFARRSCGIERRAAENEVRARFGFPAIGERWTSETILFRVVEAIVAPRKVVHHYRGKELDGLELDVWIPELKLGIEYQGQQHYQSIQHWGGVEELEKRKNNDRRKRALCKTLGYGLVEFRFDEELTEAAVEARLKRHLEPATDEGEAPTLKQ